MMKVGGVSGAPGGYSRPRQVELRASREMCNGRLTRTALSVCKASRTVEPLPQGDRANPKLITEPISVSASSHRSNVGRKEASCLPQFQQRGRALIARAR